jgi:two-component system, OmpR family, response regulator MprA
MRDFFRWLATLAAMVELLVVDDDRSIRRMLERTLAAEGFEVRIAPDGGAALAELERSLPDLLLLDVAMDGLDGLAVASRVRAKGIVVPILFLTARDAVSDRVAGLELGDDYLVKPFAAAELVARVRALLRRTREPDHELAYRDLRLDPASRRAFRGGREILLTARESALLELLLRETGRTVSRAEALRTVWAESDALPNVVDRYVAYLRRKLGEPRLIETVRGVGFRLG